MHEIIQMYNYIIKYSSIRNSTDWQGILCLSDFSHFKQPT